MTLKESKMKKRMRIKGKIDIRCLDSLFFKICIFPGLMIHRHDGNGYIPFEFNGDSEQGNYVLGVIADEHKAAERHCRMVVDTYYVE